MPRSQTTIEYCTTGLLNHGEQNHRISQAGNSNIFDVMINGEKHVMFYSKETEQ